MAHEPWAPPSLYLDTIQYAITESVKLDITYQTRGEEQLKKRIIQPYAVYFSGAVWSTIAFCELRREVREFRLDRIKELNVLPTHFTPARVSALNSIWKIVHKDYFQTLTKGCHKIFFLA